jgi:hypothetical protein
MTREAEKSLEALALLCPAFFMVILDAQTGILGLPSIEADLGLSASGAQWVLSAYPLSLVGLLLLGSHSADLLGRGWGSCVWGPVPRHTAGTAGTGAITRRCASARGRCAGAREMKSNESWVWPARRSDAQSQRSRTEARRRLRRSG